MPLVDPTTFAVLDTETTGLPKEDPDAHGVEVGIARFEGGQCVHRAQWFVRPDVLRDEHAEVAWRVSQISRAQIEGAPAPEEAWAEIHPWIKGIPIIAWNLPFDQTMIQRSFFSGGRLSGMRARRLVPPNWHECAMRRYSRHFVDQVGRWPSGEPKWSKLAHAAEQSGFSWTGQAHRADADAEMTGRIYLGLLAGTLTFTPRPPDPETAETHETAAAQTG